MFQSVAAAVIISVIFFESILPSLAIPMSTSSSYFSLPMVDLGYSIYQASVVNENNNYWNFSNIRYAAPPLGELRFAAPVQPLENRSAGAQDGSYGYICPQAIPAWESVAAANAPPGPEESEDCLFLDVVVSNNTLTNGGAPVLVWFYGGGYVFGSKSSAGDPIGLLERSNEHAKGAVYVSMNYRLGAFGWLSGPTLQSNGTANAGLLDQRRALEWVQDYIHLFGGDPQRVTVFGESAGAGGIMHHITAYGGALGNQSNLFQQAVLQSPSIHNPTGSHFQEEKIFNRFLYFANVSTIEAARNLPSETLQIASKKVVAEGPFGLFTFEPVADGSYVPDIPSKLLLQGAFDHNLTIMAGHNFNEGHVYTDPAATNSSALITYMSLYLPSADPSIISYIANELYPPVYDGTYSYTTPFSRLDLAISELMITCNTRFLATAFDNNTHNYIFSVGTGYHGSDVPYTYFDGVNSTAVLNDTLAEDLQRYVTTFAATGTPNGMENGLPMFPIYGEEAMLLDLNTTAITTTRDPTANARCAWWQKGLYL